MKRKQVIKNTYTSRQIFIKKFMKNKLAVVGSLIIIVFVHLWQYLHRYLQHLIPIQQIY